MQSEQCLRRLQEQWHDVTLPYATTDVARTSGWNLSYIYVSSTFNFNYHKSAISIKFINTFFYILVIKHYWQLILITENLTNNGNRKHGYPAKTSAVSCQHSSRYFISSNPHLVCIIQNILRWYTFTPQEPNFTLWWYWMILHSLDPRTIQRKVAECFPC